MNQLNWHWIGVSVIVPPLAGGLLALPFWRKDQAIHQGRREDAAPRVCAGMEIAGG